MVGPVLAPVSIALVMILSGTLATQSDGARCPLALCACLGSVSQWRFAVFTIDALAGAAGWPRCSSADAADDVQLVAVPVALLLMALPALHQLARVSSCARRIMASMGSRYFSSAGVPMRSAYIRSAASGRKRFSHDM